MIPSDESWQKYLHKIQKGHLIECDHWITEYLDINTLKYI